MIILYILLGLLAFFLLVTALPVIATYERKGRQNRWRLWFLLCSVGTDGFKILGIRIPEKSDKKSQKPKKKADDEKETSADQREEDKKSGKKDDKSEEKKDDLSWREMRILLDELDYVKLVLLAVLRFVVRLIKAFKIDLSDFMLHFGCPDPACVGMAQGWLYSVGISHRAYYFEWKLDGEGRFRVRIVPLYVLFIILRLIIEVRPIKLYKLYRKTKGGKDGERNSGNPEDPAGRDQGHSQDRDHPR